VGFVLYFVSGLIAIKFLFFKPRRRDPCSFPFLSQASKMEIDDDPSPLLLWARREKIALSGVFFHFFLSLFFHVLGYGINIFFSPPSPFLERFEERHRRPGATSLSFSSFFLMCVSGWC